ncbi:MAG TPA: OmpA family protein [Terracidiphilus sp.]|nr:OmpA family protein [Terracidiphilus sp.]
MKKACLVLAVAVGMVCTVRGWAQSDAAGCKDSPILTRFPGSYIASCSKKDDDAASFPIEGKPRLELEGAVETILYQFPRSASLPQVARNINTALRNAGYSIDFVSGNGGVITAHMGKTYVLVQVDWGLTYSETILTQTQLKQEVVADAAALDSGLATNGHMVVNGILFDTAKADLKPESKAALEQISKMLKQDSKMKVYVVGHTDNVGGLVSNMDLSKRRAAAVVQALTSQYGVPADRLAPYGDGPYAPVGSNDTEDGRSLNRRVELVKQ